MKKYACMLFLLLAMTNIASAKKYKLELNLVKGLTYHLNTKSVMVIRQTINGKEVKTPTTSGGDISFKVLNKTAGVYELEARFQSLLFDMGTEKNAVHVNTRMVDSNNVVSVLMGQMTNRPFIVYMYPDGKVKEIKNSDSIYAHLFDPFPTLAPAQRTQLYNVLKESFGDTAIKSNIEQATAIFPDKPVGVNDEWVSKIELKSGMSLIKETKYKLTSFENGQYKIDGKGELMNGPKKDVLMNGLHTSYDMAGDCSGETIIDAATGWTVYSVTKEKAAGKMIVAANEHYKNGLDIPVTMTIDSEIDDK